MQDYYNLLEELVIWTREAMKKAGGTKAVIGISGGKDSSVTAALMARVFGPENVLGVLMPDGIQSDLPYAEEIVRHLGIPSVKADISGVTEAFRQILYTLPGGISAQTTLNLPPRVRMTLLYAISQSLPHSRVINTSNLSEDWVGYATIYGDTAGAFSPLGMLTTQEVIELGRVMGIPEKFLLKPPADGLTGRTDEDILGISYASINRYIRHGEASPEEKVLIDRNTGNRDSSSSQSPCLILGFPLKPRILQRYTGKNRPESSSMAGCTQNDKWIGIGAFNKGKYCFYHRG